MKRKLINILDSIIEKLQSLKFRITIDSHETIAYSSLSPIDNGDENGHYSKALLWALKNRKKEDIKNIALTGTYGSGKSSILKTFQKNYKGKDLSFLNISLATFKEEKPQLDKDGKEIKVDKSDLLRLIEISILEQIFYHEEDEKIPDSRFKKIKSYSSRKLFVFSVAYLIFLIALYNYFNSNFIQSIFKDFEITNTISKVIHYSGISAIAIGVFFIILKSIRIISAITVNKLKIQDAEIGIGESLSKSILNHHIDEILYFFSVRPYNVIIIEDLDRFQETEIFTKLRELNLLLNNSEKTKRREIVFIYAVRDNMFTDRDRTKFFDFIIPVIPVINSSNSSEILVKKRNQFQYKISDNLIEDISFFIDDMRLLHNILNEFYLYKEKLNETLNQNKLFAIIAYKNIYPNDFMKLSCNEGELYLIFKSKSKILKNLINEIDKKIDANAKEITEYEDLFLDNTKDLRLIYIAVLIQNLSGFDSFYINGEALSVNKVVEDVYFEYIKTNNYQYRQIIQDRYNREIKEEKKITVKFSSIENLVNSSKTYLMREKEIIDIKTGKINSLKSKIQELEKQKRIARNYKIAELLQSDLSEEIEISENLNIDFINVLLRNGHIDEDYIDYISLFHEESITRSDYQFHINVKNEIQQPFEYKLFKIKKLLTKISPLDFQKEYILNYDILDHLLSQPDKYKTHLESIFSKLRDESQVSIEFIKGYYEVSQKLESFMKLLCNNWSNIFGFVDSSPYFSENLKKSIFKSVIEYGESNAIIEISKQSNLITKILSNPLFLNIIDNQKKLENVIEILKIEFTKIDFENSSEEMLNFIYKNKFYELNIEMVASLIKKFGVFNQIEFDKSNYSAIKSSDANYLISYIDEKINDYIKNLYLKISSNINEKESYLVQLLNNEDISVSNKELIIEQVQTKIIKLELIEDSDLYAKLLENNKIIATWENLLHHYNFVQDDEKDDGLEIEKTISESSITFINILKNAEELSKVKLPREVNSQNIYGEFWKELIQLNTINDQSYNLIIKSSPWWYSDLNFGNLSEEKIKSLINNTCINPVAKSFNLLKENFDVLHIYLFEKRKVDYFKIINEIPFDDCDLELILKSTILNNSEKLKVLENCSEETIITNNNLKLLSTILLEDNLFTVTENVYNSILLSNQVPIIERIKLFLKNSNNYDLTFILSFLINLGGKYAQVTDTSTKAKIVKNPDNRQLLRILVNKGFLSSFSELDSGLRVNHKRSK